MSIDSELCYIWYSQLPICCGASVLY